MSDKIAKSYNSIYELPSEVLASFDKRDAELWMKKYNEELGDQTSEEAIEDAKFKAWKSMVDAPSSLAVESWASVEVRDADGELVPIDTIADNMDRFIHNKGTMHDSHSNVVIGSAWGWERRKHPETGEDGIVLYFNINHDGEVAERARDDILSGRKNALSIGAEAPRGGYKCDDRGCYVERDVTDLYEISICETPANPEAVFLNVGKDIAKAKTPIKGEVFRIGIKDVVVHQDYTTCPLQKCKHDLLNKGFKNIHITDNGIVTAKSKKNEYKLFKAIHKMGYPFRYDLKKEQFEIMPDYGVEQAIEEAVENGWAHEDQVGHVCLTKEIPKEVFMDWYDRGFICKIGDFYCLKGDDVAKDGMNKMDMPDEVKLWANRIIEEIEAYQNGGPSRYDMVSRIKMYIEQINQSLDRKYDYDDYLNESTKKKVNKSLDGVKQIFEQFTDDDIVMINQAIKEHGGISDFGDLSAVLFGLTNKSTKKKVKKDGGAMGVSTAGATNAVYGSKPTSLVTPAGDKKYGKKKKTKKEMTDDGNIHAVGSRQAKDVKKGHGNYFDAIENFIVDSPEGVYYNDILDEFSDSLDEDDVLDALEQICNDGQIAYNPNTERFAVVKNKK